MNFKQKISEITLQFLCPPTSFSYVIDFYYIFVWVPVICFLQLLYTIVVYADIHYSVSEGQEKPWRRARKSCSRPKTFKNAKIITWGVGRLGMRDFDCRTIKNREKSCNITESNFRRIPNMDIWRILYRVYNTVTSDKNYSKLQFQIFIEPI